MGLNPRTLGSQPELKADAQSLSHPTAEPPRRPRSNQIGPMYQRAAWGLGFNRITLQPRRTSPTQVCARVCANMYMSMKGKAPDLRAR